MSKKWSNNRIDSMLEEKSATFIRAEDTSDISAPSIMPVLWKCLICSHTWRATVDSVNSMNSGCPKCAGNSRMSLSEIQKRLNKEQREIIIDDIIPGSKNNERKGIFVCKICNTEWKSTLSNIFYNQQGCPKCNKSGRYNTAWFDSHPELKTTPALLYLVRFSNDEEDFIKVGITRHNIFTRFPKYKYPYVMCLYQSVNTTLYHAWKEEQNILQQFSKYLYLPKQHIGGRTECLTLIPLQQINQLLKEMTYEEYSLER